MASSNLWSWNPPLRVSSPRLLTTTFPPPLRSPIPTATAISFFLKHTRSFHDTRVRIAADHSSSDTVVTHAAGQHIAPSLHSSPVGLCDTVIGVLGGGQLGRMLCQAASCMGLKVAILDPEKDCPANALAYFQVVGSFQDRNAVRDFAKRCGVLTVEIEHVDVETLEELEKEGLDVQPKPSTIKMIQDKYIQKMHFKQHGIALPDFMKIDDIMSAEAAGIRFGYPLMIKSRRFAYDGRGNAAVYNKEMLSEAISSLGGFERGLYAEKWAAFVQELAVMVARSRDGNIRCYPVVETVHKDNICHMVEAPAQVSVQVMNLALQMAEKAVRSLEGAGVFGVELFLKENGQVLLNEIAPRPHNCGHYTIEACYASQFEQHLRAILGFPLGDCSMKVPSALMYNLLGEDEGQSGFFLAQEKMRRAVAIPGAAVHWYGKAEIRKQRKMGHITVVGPTAVVRSRMKEIIGQQSVTARSSEILGNVEPLMSECASIDRPRESGALVGIIMGSESDLPIMKSAAEVLEFFKVPYELTVISAHRTPERMMSYSKDAHGRGIKVIIAGAGGAAHLPGMVAAMTPLPVIGVPVKGSSLDGIDSLLSIVQMPKGIPVATVAINNAMNAALLAVRILSSLDKSLHEKVVDYHVNLKETVLQKAERLEQEGWQAYLQQ